MEWFFGTLIVGGAIWWWSARNRSAPHGKSVPNQNEAEHAPFEFSFEKRSNQPANKSNQTRSNRSPHDDQFEYDVFVDKRYREFVRAHWDLPGVDASGIAIDRISGGYAETLQLKSVVAADSAIYVNGWSHGEPKTFVADQRAQWRRSGKGFSYEAFAEAVETGNANLSLSPEKHPATIDRLKPKREVTSTETHLSSGITVRTSSSVGSYEPDKYRFDDTARPEWSIIYDEQTGQSTRSDIFIHRWKDDGDFTYFDAWFYATDERRILRSDRIVESKNLYTNRKVKSIRAYLMR